MKRKSECINCTDKKFGAANADKINVIEEGLRQLYDTVMYWKLSEADKNKLMGKCCAYSQEIWPQTSLANNV